MWWGDGEVSGGWEFVGLLMSRRCLGDCTVVRGCACSGGVVGARMASSSCSTHGTAPYIYICEAFLLIVGYSFRDAE